MKFDCPPSSKSANISREVSVHTFTLSSVDVPQCKEPSMTDHLWKGENDAGGSAGFFYFVNVTALVLVIATIFFYVIFWDLYQENKRFVLVDLGATALFFILFFFCSSIWWAGSNTIGYSTGDEGVQKLLRDNSNFWGNKSSLLDLERNTNNGKLAISVLCDWVCVLCFAFNCWFIWKEIVPRDQEQPGVIG